MREIKVFVPDSLLNNFSLNGIGIAQSIWLRVKAGVKTEISEKNKGFFMWLLESDKLTKYLKQ